MPSVDQLRTRLLKKLKELFQLDQPDLDFGFYRIMHAKAGHVSAFIENDLLQIIRDAFGSADDSRKTELQAAYDQAMREALEEYGSPDPENTPKAKKLKAELAAAKDTATAEGDIYDHLYRFFERYYDTGDFISRRYYARETSDKAAPYAVPYNGEEVKLHWANADQYYIKTADHFTHFTFDLKKAKKELTNLFGKTRSFGGPKPTTFSQRFCEQAVVKDKFVCDFFAGSGTTGEAVINLNRAEGRKQKYLLIEMGDHFNSILKPRIAKVVFSENWKDGKPQPRHPRKPVENEPGLFSVPSVVNEFNGMSHCFKYIRLESYEDTLNNLVFDKNPARSKMIAENSSLREDFMLRYLLDVETRGSQSLLNIDAFSDSTAYTLNVKKPGSDEITPRHIDLIETFNYLIGLRVNHMAVPQTFTAEFKYIEDPEVPKGQKTKLVVDGRLQKTTENTEKHGNSNIDSVSSVVKKSWWFRKIEGWIPKDPNDPNNGQQLKILIVWRKLTGDLEKDNAVLDAWFLKNRISTRDFEFDIIYVNGCNNLPNLKREEDNWKVRLIEEEFMKRMWNAEGV